MLIGKVEHKNEMLMTIMKKHLDECLIHGKS